MSEGVEWAAHCCLVLDWMDGEAMPTAKLAAAFELPAHYLNKQLQPLAKAGILTSTAGKKGGFRLARPLEEITLMDVVAAIEGPQEAFQCTEIRQKGVWADEPESAFKLPCAIDGAMKSAELEWRKALASKTLADISATACGQAPGLKDRVRDWYAQRGR
ncbi:RrF2 family transcriptional regulator [Salininema proteolyticum]|uniref:RrF2 family transcriptional regulator n=1 Tax=Salininema proteolyticum TaxID=1607685 RepID=A0ABV8TY82_9ACTN